MNLYQNRWAILAYVICLLLMSTIVGYFSVDLDNRRKSNILIDSYPDAICVTSNASFHGEKNCRFENVTVNIMDNVFQANAPYNYPFYSGIIADANSCEDFEDIFGGNDGIKCHYDAERNYAYLAKVDSFPGPYVLFFIMPVIMVAMMFCGGVSLCLEEEVKQEELPPKEFVTSRTEVEVEEIAHV